MSVFLTSHFNPGRKGAEDDSPALLCQVDKADKAPEDGVTPFVASTDREDRAGDIVVQNWRLRNFRANPVILWMHRHMDLPIGRGESVSQGTAPNKRLTMNVRWDVGEHNPVATSIGAQFARGMLHTGSVSFYPGKTENRSKLPSDHPHFQELPEGTPAWMAGLRFDQNELLEFSATTIPANVDAVALRSWARARSEDPVVQIEAVAVETMQAEHREWLLRAVRSDEEVRAVILEALLSMPGFDPPAPPKAAPEPNNVLELIRSRSSAGQPSVLDRIRSGSTP